MDPIIKQTIDGMLSSFDHVQVSDPAVAADIEQYKQDMYALGQRSSDAGAFMAELQSTGLMARMSELMTRASTASAPSAPAAGQGGGPPALPSVREFLGQYRSAYDAVRAHGFQFTAVKAYEQLFAVADRTDHLLTMHIMLEQEGHLRAMTARSLYDINKLQYDLTDPNNAGVRAQFRALMELAESYQTDEELHYRTDLLVQQNQQGASRHEFMIPIVAQLALACLAYHTAKSNARTDLKRYAGQFVAARDSVRNTYAAMHDLFGLTYDAVLAQPWLKHWLLSPQTLDSTGRVTKCLDVRNLDYFREVIFEEAYGNLTDLECLGRLTAHPFYPALNTGHDPEHQQADERIQQVGRQRLSDKYYFGYEQKAGHAS